MATEIAALGLKADSSGVVKATDDLKSLAGAAGEAERAAEKLSGGAKKADTAVRQEGNAARRAANDNKRLADQVKSTDGAFQRLATQAGAGVSGALSRLASNISGSVNGALHKLAELAGTATGKLIALGGALLSVNALKNAADSWSDMQSVIGAAVKDMEAAPALMQEILRLANASYSSLEQTARGFAANVGALKDLGLNTKQALDYTEALNHMLVITATKGEQAASVQNALSKAMATGRLQADGLETVLANGGRVAEALASELGTTTSGLRDMASQGRITGRVIADALLRSLEDVRREAGEMPTTIGDGLLKVGNGMLALIGVIDQGTSASQTIAEKLNDVVEWLARVAQSDFSGWMDKARGAVTVFGQALLVLAATRIPALIAGFASANLAGGLMIAQFIAGAAASRAMTAAMAAQAAAARGLAAALALVGGPIGLAVAGATTLGLALWNTRSRAEDVKRSMDALAVSQGDLNRVTEEYYRNRSEQTLAAMTASATAVRDQIEAALAAAQEELDRANRKDTILWLGLRESDPARTAAARQAVEDLSLQLVEAENRLSAMDHAASNFARSLGEARGVAQALNQDQARAHDTLTGMLADLQRQNELRAAEVEYGHESTQYLAVQQQHERDILNVKLQTLEATLKGVDGVSDLTAGIRQALQAQQAAEAGAHRWAAAMASVKGHLQGIAGVLYALGGGFMDRVSMNAQMRVMDAGGTAAEARRAGIHAQEDARLRDQQVRLRGQLGDVVGGFMGRALELELDQRRAMEVELERRYASLEASGGGGGGGGSAGGAGGSVSETQRQAKAIQDVVRGLEDEIRLIGASETARRTHAALQQAGVELYSAEGQKIADLTEKLVAMEEQQRQVEQRSQAGANAMANLFMGISKGGDAAKQAVAQLLAELARVQMMKGVLGLSGGGFFGGLVNLLGGGLTLNANGGVYSSPSLSAYSNQVVDRPTLFAFANGAGLMGEAGPEAIMPLSRGPDGRLGVRTEAPQQAPAARDSKLHVSVEVLENGNIRAVARDEAGQVVAQSAPQLISRSVQASQKSMRKSKAPWGI